MPSTQSYTLSLLSSLPICLQNTWPYGYSMPIAVRYTQDAFSRSGWLWPVDAKGEPLKATSYMAYCNRSEERFSRNAEDDLVFRLHLDIKRDNSNRYEVYST